MGLKWRQQVQLITATLAVTPWFEREIGSCCVRKETKQVIYASNAPQLATATVPVLSSSRTREPN